MCLKCVSALYVVAWWFAVACFGPDFSFTGLWLCAHNLKTRFSSLPDAVLVAVLAGIACFHGRQAFHAAAVAIGLTFVLTVYD